MGLPTALSFQQSLNVARAHGLLLKHAAYDGARWRAVFEDKTRRLIEVVGFQRSGAPTDCVLERSANDGTAAMRQIWPEKALQNSEQLPNLVQFIQTGQSPNSLLPQPIATEP